MSGGMGGGGAFQREVHTGRILDISHHARVIYLGPASSTPLSIAHTHLQAWDFQKSRLTYLTSL